MALSGRNEHSELPAGADDTRTGGSSGLSVAGVRAPAGGAGDPGADAVAGLVERAAVGDESAWLALSERYTRRVYAMVYGHVRQPELAEEITQSVFVTVATKLAEGKYAEYGRFESWLFRITMNRVRDEVRRGRRQAKPMDPAAFAGSVGDTGAGVSSGSDVGEDLERMRDAIARLPEADRVVIDLRHRGQLGFQAISEMLGEPVGTLLARHHRALRKLRKLLDGSGAAGGDAEGRRTKR